jgi:hypothetical protein
MRLVDNNTAPQYTEARKWKLTTKIVDPLVGR